MNKVKRALNDLFAKVLPYFNRNEFVTLEFDKEQILLLKEAIKEKECLKWENLDFESFPDYDVKLNNTYYKLTLDTYYNGVNEVQINPVDKQGKVYGEPIAIITSDKEENIKFFDNLKFEVVE